MTSKKVDFFYYFNTLIMDFNQFNNSEKKVYWEAYYEQSYVIDKFRQEMIKIYSELDVVDSEWLVEIINQIFKGDSKEDYAEKAVKIFKSEKKNILYISFKS